MNANQINKRMIHMVDDLLGGPKQNKEERITCILALNTSAVDEE